MVVVYTSKWKC